MKHISAAGDHTDSAAPSTPDNSTQPASTPGNVAQPVASTSGEADVTQHAATSGGDAGGAAAPGGDVKVERTPNPMGTQPIGKLIAQFSIPTIVMMVFNSLYNIIDTAFLQIAVPITGAAVTQLAFPVQTILMGFSMLGGIGGNAMAAIELGRGNRAKVGKILGNTAVLLFGIAVVVGICSVLFADPLLTALGASAELWEPAKSFITIICVGFAFQSLGMGLNNFLRTAGRPNLSLGCSVLGTVACIVLNYVFVIVMGLGVAGSAYATVIGQAAGMVPVMAFFLLYKGEGFKLQARNCIPDVRLIVDICALGLASFAIQVAQTAVTIVMNHVIGIWGAQDPMGFETALSTISIAWKVLSMAYMPIIGITSGVQPLLGFNVGAQLWSRVLKLYKWACIDCFLVAAAFQLVFWVMPQAPLALFSVRADLMPFACDTIRMFSFWLGPVGFQIMASSYFQSSGQPMKATILELTRQFLFLIPLYILMPGFAVSVLGMSGLDGVRLAPPISDILAFVVTVAFFTIEWRKLKRLESSSSSLSASIGHQA